MAHKVGSGSTRNNRDSISKRLGLKVGNFQKITAGSIIVRQRGYNIRNGESVRCAKDFTLYSLKSGIVRFLKKNLVTVI